MTQGDQTSEPKKYADPTPVNINRVRDALPAPAGPAVVSNGVTDEVKLSACVYRNQYARKSLTVHHLQRRLGELGYAVALSDRDGWYGDPTRIAVLNFQEKNGIEGDGIVDAATFSAIFAGDPNVTVII
jgi:peptidoglycan hydrolase-like protein with peptidoglycan-binding domain